MRDAQISTPDFFAFSETAFKQLGAADTLPAIEERLGFPVVVKPADQGSALGIRFAPDAGAVPAALVAAFSYSQKVLLEQAITSPPARELAVSVLGDEPLPIVEAIPIGEDFYDFEARYEIGRTEFVCPAGLDDETTGRVQALALEVHQLLGCRSLSRVDLMLDADGRPWVLEVNTVPGMTETSLLPQAADAAGIDFDELVARILRDSG
jgi:D-alanine-D-alanine ligase